MKTKTVNLEKASVKLNNITKIFDSPKMDESVTAVDDFNLDFKEGELTTLLGPSGCGKTTTLRMIAGFEDPTNGDIYFNDQRVNDLAANKRDSAMVFQSYALFPHMTVAENITYGLRFKKMNKAKQKEKLNEILRIIGMEGYEDRRPGELSGGQQQRVALSRALIMEPKVLLFDEPLSNLDAKLRETMRNEIRRIQRDLSITTIYVTHDQDEAMSISDNIVIMNDGHIEQVGNPEEVYFQPKNEFVADFIGTVNLLPAEITNNSGNSFTLDIMGERSLTKEQKGDFNIGDEVQLVVRPESLDITEKDEGLINGKINNRVFLGTHNEYYIDIGLKKPIKINIFNTRLKEDFQRGDEISIDFNSSDVHIVE